jgi:hypothetical protein
MTVVGIRRHVPGCEVIAEAITSEIYPVIPIDVGSGDAEVRDPTAPTSITRRLERHIVLGVFEYVPQLLARAGRLKIQPPAGLVAADCETMGGCLGEA